MTDTYLNFNILTLFPNMFPGSLGLSLSGRALEKKIWSYQAINIRDFATDTHKTVDDTPFGGGAGMVMKPNIISDALQNLNQDTEQNSNNIGRFIYLSPRGTPLTQTLVKDLSQSKNITLLCGRYEGVDQRLLDAYDAEEISVGDYVLSGGEIAALTLMDACIRILPSVMGNASTTNEESFENGLLEYPHYTRPAKWTDPNGKSHEIPKVLTSGHHKNIQQWRIQQSEEITEKNRPDLWLEYIKKK